MLSHEFMPAGFRVVTESSDLQIHYRTPKRRSFYGALFLLLPFVALFILYLVGLGGIVYLSLTEGTEAAGQVLSPVLGESPGGMLLLMIGIFILLAAVTSVFFWLVWGRVEFQATDETLILKKQLWFFAWEQHIARSQIQAFEQFEEQNEDNNIPTWRLGLIVRGEETDSWNEMRSRQVDIFGSTHAADCEWLGEKLASFYRVPFDR
jgi:hypothetical protein